MTDAQANFIFVHIWDNTEFGPGGIRTHNLLIFGKTHKPSFLGVCHIEFVEAITGLVELEYVSVPHIYTAYILSSE